MNSGKTILSHLMDVLSPYELRKCIERYEGNYKDHAALVHHGVLRNHRERWEDPDLVRNQPIRGCGHCEEDFETGSDPLHNFTDFERHSF
jgi:hypothetical protein